MTLLTSLTSTTEFKPHWNNVNTRIIRSEECAAAFDRMFWAFLFFLDFRLGVNNVHVDVLPDFIGWLMIASALTSILELTPKMHGIRTLAYWLVFLSLFDMVEIRIPFMKSGNFTGYISPTFPLGIIATILDLLLIWKLCGVIIEMATAVGDDVIHERADFRRRIYLIFAICLSLSVLVSFVIPPIAIVAVIIGLPVGLVMFCLMMGLMKGTANLCREASL